MKTFKNLFAILILSVAFYSCDADATLDDVEQAELTEFNHDLSVDTGDQGNEHDEREEEEDLVGGN
ncbi:hypothetical protein FF125_05650 [Aureibaculum algae]|uniref:Secreted protein n=1 Tax=Aureibaculum algae TaxID=2584122 RepID=A0A5B7TR65_9FLAO|nr:hypothetical protein [Aureibaculum algae]QCX37941.1 hypothetical protein FF125_05650 [Aureibaculum algae]